METQTPTVAVVGQLARDLVLRVPDSPGPGQAADASDRCEQLGGKGANQAVGLAQLGTHPALVAVVGDDDVGTDLLAQARRDGIDVSAVVRREQTATGLIVEVLDDAGRWRYVQHLPEEVLLSEGDVRAAKDVISSADAVLVQLQQPPAAALVAARIGVGAGRLVVLDGVPPASHRPELLGACDVLRADAHEAELLLGASSDDPGAVRAAATDLLSEGPSLVAVGLADGNLFVWRDGTLTVPLTEEDMVDTTGGGDAFVAALTAALLRGHGYAEAACHAVAASGATIGHAGGRPDLDAGAMRQRVAAIQGRLTDG